MVFRQWLAEAEAVPIPFLSRLSTKLTRTWRVY